jgi:integrase
MNHVHLALSWSTKMTKTIRHSRHTFRSWLTAVGTAPEITQKAMRHTDIRTSFNVYGDDVMGAASVAIRKVSQLAFNANGVQTECEGT